MTTTSSFMSMPASSAESVRLSERSELGLELGGKEPRLLPGREVPAFVRFMEVDQVGIRASGPGLRRAIHVLREYGDGHGYRDLGGLPGGRGRWIAADVFPIQPR